LKDTSASLIVLSEQLLAVAEDLRSHQVVELRDASGRKTSLYSRYLSPEGTKWLRHGLYQDFYPNGGLASESMYRHDLAHGPWRDLYENGQLAARGLYYQGKQVGTWEYWDPDGKPEEPEHFPEPPGPF
jgi:hypothetical protein